MFLPDLQFGTVGFGSLDYLIHIRSGFTIRCRIYINLIFHGEYHIMKRLTHWSRIVIRGDLIVKAHIFHKVIQCRGVSFTSSAPLRSSSCSTLSY